MSAISDVYQEVTGSGRPETHDLEEVLDGLRESAEDASDGKMTVGDTVDAFAARSFGALLTMVALVAAMPIIGAIPGVSILTGTIIVLVCLQFLAGRDAPWLPKRVRDISIDADKMTSAIETVRPYVAKVDRVIRPRLTFLTKGGAPQTIIAIASIFLAALFYPAAFIPGGVWVPSLAVLFLGLALVGNDGVLALIGWAGAAGSIALLFWLL